MEGPGSATIKDCVCLSCCSTSTVINWGHIRTISYLTTRFLVKPPGCSLPVFSAFSFTAIIVTSHRDNGRVTDKKIISSIRVRSYPFYVRFSSSESVPCPWILSLWCPVPSGRWEVLNMFKTFHRTKRTKKSVWCTVAIRYRTVCSELVRYISCTYPVSGMSVKVRWNYKVA